MDYCDIQDKELKMVLHLLDIMQNSSNLSEEDKRIYDALNSSFPVISEEKSIIYNYAHSFRWIEAPESFPNNHGGRDVYLIDSSVMHDFIRITPVGKKELMKLLPFAKNWLSKKEQSEKIDNLQKQLLETQLDSIRFAQQTTKETIEVAKSAKCAAWASAFGAIFTALLALIALILNLLAK